MGSCRGGVARGGRAMSAIHRCARTRSIPHGPAVRYRETGVPVPERTRLQAGVEKCERRSTNRPIQEARKLEKRSVRRRKEGSTKMEAECDRPKIRSTKHSTWNRARPPQHFQVWT